MHVKFAQLPIYNQDRAINFYTENLDCEVVTDESYGEDHWRWIELAFPGAQTKGFCGHPLKMFTTRLEALLLLGCRAGVFLITPVSNADRTIIVRFTGADSRFFRCHSN